MSHNHTEKMHPSQTIRQLQEGVYFMYKKSGETLAVFLERAREELGLGKGVPVTYAGRLDPMAEGEMIVLVGEACKKKDEFLGRDKSYRVEILLGIETDTLDMLGIVTREDSRENKKEDTEEGVYSEAEIQKALLSLSSRTEFPYPAYSSKPYDGVPLFVHARQGTLPASIS